MNEYNGSCDECWKGGRTVHEVNVYTNMYLKRDLSPICHCFFRNILHRINKGIYLPTHCNSGLMCLALLSVKLAVQVVPTLKSGKFGI